jgi:hypothetical protein
VPDGAEDVVIDNGAPHPALERLVTSGMPPSLRGWLTCAWWLWLMWLYVDCGRGTCAWVCPCVRVRGRRAGVVDFLTYTYSTWTSGGGASKLDVPALFSRVRELSADTDGGIFQVRARRQHATDARCADAIAR